MNRLNMMEQMQMEGEEEDDIYGGYNTYDALNPDAIAQDTTFQEAVRTSHGRRQPTLGGTLGGGARLATAVRGNAAMAGGRLQTGMQVGGMGVGDTRPMTAVRAAGYTSYGGGQGGAGVMGGGANFDPMRQKDRGPAPPLEKTLEESPEERIRLKEKKIMHLIEESCQCAVSGDTVAALEKAKQAGSEERQLIRTRDQMGIADQLNLDLTYSVLFNLANQQMANEMYQDAYRTYQAIVKNKMFSHAGRLKVNMGNIFFKQKDYKKAIKFYRMGLDQVPNTHKSMRIKIMQNIGIAFVKLGQYPDAITSFEHIMQEEPDFKTGFNLILCYYAKKDKQKMKAAFQKLLNVDLKLDDEDRYMAHSDDKQYELILEVIRNDELRQFEKERKSQAEKCIRMAAKIISPAIDNDFSAGYDWCIDQVKLSTYSDLGNDLEIDKAIMHLKQKDFNQAIETLKSFERKDTRVASTAATNLSFLYYLEGDLNQADKYAEKAIGVDRYNSAALVNKGNILYQHKDFEKAREYYKDALINDAACVEALYNLGLVNKRLERFEESLDCFQKLHSILRNDSQVLYQIADLNEKVGEKPQALEWFMQVNSIIGSDPMLLQRLGDLTEEEGDKAAAFSHYYDSFKYYPSNIEVIEWLGAYYIESSFSEKAIAYFERASMMQPAQVKWQLMIASCHRRSGNYQQALETYKSIHKKFPDNIECLQFLVRLCTDMGLKEAQDYANRLKKAERQRELREQRQTSASRRGSLAPGGRVGGSREGSAGSGVGGGSREGSAHRRSAGGRRGSARWNAAMGDEDGGGPVFEAKPVGDVTYSDPLGPAAERPKTAARSRPVQDEFADEELDDTLLPE